MNLAKSVKNDYIQDNATKTLSNITSQTQQIKNLIHSTSEEEGNGTNDQMHMFNTTSDSEDRYDDNNSYPMSDNETGDICSGEDSFMGK